MIKKWLSSYTIDVKTEKGGELKEATLVPLE